MSKTERRTFLKTLALTLGGASVLPGGLKALASVSAPVSPTIAMQLYTVRDDMKADPAGTLRQLAAMGYRNLEHANYVNHLFYGYGAAAFRKLLDSLGLRMISGHVQLRSTDWNNATKDFTDGWKRTVDDAATCGQTFLVNPWLDEDLRKDYDKLMAFLDVFNRCGTLCRSKGLQFGYHNHDFEFRDQLGGKKLYDIILGATDPSLVAQQLDIGNMYGGGGRPLDVLAQYPGRFMLMHVKDLIPSKGPGEMNTAYESTILGKGILGTHEILKAAMASGKTTQLIIEQESYQGRRPLDDCRSDLAAMRAWGF